MKRGIKKRLAFGTGIGLAAADAETLALLSRPEDLTGASSKM